MYAEHRTWFPFILAGISLLLLVVFVTIAEPSAPQTNTQSGSAFVEIGVEAPTNEEYQANILSLIARYDAEKNPGQTYDDLLQVRVPAAYRDVHLEFVYAFAALKSGNDLEGNARLDLLRQQLEWLN